MSNYTNAYNDIIKYNITEDYNEFENEYIGFIFLGIFILGISYVYYVYREDCSCMFEICYECCTVFIYPCIIFWKKRKNIHITRIHNKLNNKPIRMTDDITIELKENICSICLETIISNDSETEIHSNVVLLKCNHTFHKTCITTWLNIKQSFDKKINDCPLCRNKVKIDKVYSIQQVEE
jgi:hypothetical protein